MRLKALLLYNLSFRRAILIFYGFYMAGTLFGSIISGVAQVNYMGVSIAEEGVTESWSSSIVAFAIFMIISALIVSQKETRFLITRSVSRKEIFLANAITFVPLAAIMTLLQLIGIAVDAAIRAAITGGEYRGLALDIQGLQAPDMSNILMFFLVSFAILLSMATLGYLIGSCMARWKIPTIGVLTIMGIVLFGCMIIPDFMKGIVDAFRFMFTDEKTGFWIALKHALLACALMAAVYPVMRRITAARQTQ